MKKKIFILIFVSLAFSISKIKADEGMWLPILIDRLNNTDLQKMGLQLKPEEIYSVNNASMKDGIVLINNGMCTGEMVSPEGLMLTAYHCAIDYIAENSTLEKNYLKNGFWAMNKQEEIPNPGLTVSFLVRMENVTEKVFNNVEPNMTESIRKIKIAEAIRNIETEAGKGTFYVGKVRSFYEGNEYYLFVYETYKDVRLVGAPPHSMGSFGGDTDNWTWPRHGCDFSLLRIYTSPDGKPAEYSKNNIPFKPKYYFPLSLNGIQKDDGIFIMGYPGRTQRYLTSYGVNNIINYVNPAKIKVGERKMAIIKADMTKDPEVNIKYAAKFQDIGNFWKLALGQNKGLKKDKVYKQKKDQEDNFQKWVDADAKRKEKYGTVLADIKDAYDQINKYALYRQYFSEIVINGTDILNLAYRFYPLYKELGSTTPNDEKIASLKESLVSSVRNTFKNINIETDKKLFIDLYKVFYDDVPKDQHPDVYSVAVDNELYGDFDKLGKIIYDASIFVSQKKLLKFLESEKPNVNILTSDIGFKTMLSFYEQRDKIDASLIEANWKREKAMRVYMEGLMEMNAGKIFYPDANSTLRISFGKVEGYYPGDGAEYNYYTTLDGVIQKEDPENEDEFSVPERLKELYHNKDYGRYGSDGQLVVDFISNNDVTGGNSGGPIFNAKGQLIGVTFDANWESMSRDISFEASLLRTINVDIRYVLFVMDKFAGASYLFNEMNIIEKDKTVQQKPVISDNEQENKIKQYENEIAQLKANIAALNSQLEAKGKTTEKQSTQVVTTSVPDKEKDALLKQYEKEISDLKAEIEKLKKQKETKNKENVVVTDQKEVKTKENAVVKEQKEKVITKKPEKTTTKVKNTGGFIYTVQVGEGNTDLSYFSKLDKVKKCSAPGKNTRFTVGEFKTREEADKYMQEMIAKGYKDAWVRNIGECEAGFNCSYIEKK